MLPNTASAPLRVTEKTSSFEASPGCGDSGPATWAFVTSRSVHLKLFALPGNNCPLPHHSSEALNEDVAGFHVQVPA